MIELKENFTLLSKEKNIGELIGTSGKVTPKVIKIFFRQWIIDSIIAIDPKVIVLLGYSAYHDLTLSTDYKKMKVHRLEIKLSKDHAVKYKMISISCKGNWSLLLDEIAAAIMA